jgi:hypothetical protein
MRIEKHVATEEAAHVHAGVTQTRRFHPDDRFRSLTFQWQRSIYGEWLHGVV